MFALANAGGVAAYAPLLTLLLPAKILLVAGPSYIEWMGAAVFSGALAASASNIAFGWLSDVTGTRRGWASAGLTLTLASYLLLYVATSFAAVIIAVCLFQCALNMLLAPLAAWTADSIPDDRKGRLGGLLGAGPVVGAAAGVIATLPRLSHEWMQLAAVCAIVAMLTAPLLTTRHSFPEPHEIVTRDVPLPASARPSSDLALLWLSRLLVQVAGGALFAFLLYYFHSLPQPPLDGEVAQLTAVALLIAFPVAYWAGGTSDRIGRRKPFLILAALVGATGLMIMAAVDNVIPSAAGYLLFAGGSAVFLALHSGFAMQLLPSPRYRGRDLGLLNLTNTLPSLAAPLLALWIVPQHGFGPLLATLAVLLLLAALTVLLIRRDDSGQPRAARNH